jgi:hypothetical protein
VARNGSETQPTSIVQKASAELVGTFAITLVATTVDVLYFTRAGNVDFVSRWLARGFITTAVRRRAPSRADRDAALLAPQPRRKASG